jgi:hypothetical protein
VARNDELFRLPARGDARMSEIFLKAHDLRAFGIANPYRSNDRGGVPRWPPSRHSRAV